MSGRPPFRRGAAAFTSVRVLPHSFPENEADLPTPQDKQVAEKLAELATLQMRVKHLEKELAPKPADKKAKTKP